jgi:hypothetical protein
MASYDPGYIESYARRLQARAASAMGVSAVLGVFLGWVIAPFALQNLPVWLTERMPEWGLAAAFGVIGLLQGWERAGTLRLQAQSALCQLQIEKNTRGPANTAGATRTVS